jgi:gliding motility-associated-like protein
MKAKEADFSCGGIQSFNIIVNSESPINIQDSYTICFNPNTKPPVIINADISNDRVEWRNNEGDIISTNNNFTLDRIGEFSLTVFKTENGLLCSNSRNFTVKNPEKPVFLAVNVNTEDETNNIMDIIIEGNSTYEFSLDSINFQGNSTNYTFTNVTSGLRTVYVRDINACEEGIQVNVPVIGFKDFFTPNGDGKNDYWNINGLDTTSFKYINVRVFDRLGKLIFLIKDFDSRGWDGTYNGENLPSNSYWFKAEIIDKDNKMINEVGSFSLIRN